MPLFKDEAIVLFKRAFGESDKIIRFFTLNSGKLSAIAKGGGKSQKRFMNTLEPFNHIRIEYFEKQEKGLVRIENADVIETNHGIDASLKRISIASFFTEFVDRLTKDKERHHELFHDLRELLLFVKTRELSYREILRYQLKMLRLLGYMPNFHSCVYCGKVMPDDGKTLFSKERGGILCVDCSRIVPSRRYTSGVIPALSILGKADNTIREEDVGIAGDNGMWNRELEVATKEIIEDFIRYHLDVRLKSYRILRSILI